MNDEFSQLPADEVPSQSRYRSAPEPVEEGVEVPHALIPKETLEQLIISFIEREGTDYGANEVKLSTKIDQITHQLEKGEIKIVFDLTTESCTIVPKRCPSTFRPKK